MTGVVADVLKDAGVDHALADNIGTAATVLSTLAYGVAGGTRGLVALGAREGSTRYGRPASAPRQKEVDPLGAHPPVFE